MIIELFGKKVEVSAVNGNTQELLETMNELCIVFHKASERDKANGYEVYSNEYLKAMGMIFEQVKAEGFYERLGIQA